MPTATQTSEGLPTICNLPGAQNPYFVGRRDLLQEIENALTDPAGRQNAQVIAGPTGTGKTAAALEFAFTRQHLYDIIWYIRAETPAGIAMDLAKLAGKLSLDGHEPNLQGAARAVRRALQTRDRWLLIFDDAHSPWDISDCLPTGGKGHVLITSHGADWKPLASAFPLGAWPREDSLAFLQLHMPTTRYRSVADKLALALGDLPMALEQAAAYIAQSGIRPEDYLKAFEAQWAQKLVKGKPGDEYPSPTALAWELSFAQLAANNPAAAELLALCAFLGTEQIPLEMISDAVMQLPESLAAYVMDRSQLNVLVSLLRQYSLAQVSRESLRVHGLTARLLRHRLSPDDRAKWAGVAMNVASRAFPFDSQDPTFWPRCAEALPHVLQSATHAREAEVAPSEVAALLDQAGCFLLKQAQFAQARDVLEIARELVKEKIGQYSTMAARIANNLGRVRQRLGDSLGAMELFEAAMEIDALRYGPTTPYMATMASNLGIALAAVGQLDRARERFEWAMNVFEDHYGRNHIKIASVLNNLGVVMMKLNHPAEANDCFRRAMFIVESAHSNHPNMACIALNLGCLLQTEGQMNEAGQLLNLALQIDETRLGAHHPRVSRDLAKLAGYHRQLGATGEAIKCLDRARQIIESAYGPQSAELIPILKDLGEYLKAAGQADRGAEFTSRAAALDRNTVLGSAGTATDPSLTNDDSILGD
jgi:tetratricopeptide (TPR) repeat protein